MDRKPGEVKRPFTGIGLDTISEAAFAALPAAMVGDPLAFMAGILAGSLKPVTERAIRLAQAEFRANELRVSAMYMHAAAHADVTLDELMDRAETHAERMYLATSAAVGAGQSLDYEWIVAIGRDLAEGLLTDELDEVAVYQQMIDALTAIKRPHLAILDKMTHWSAVGIDKHAMNHREIVSCFPSYKVPFWRIMATLEREGLVTRLDGADHISGLVTFDGNVQWRPTEFGFQLLSKLKIDKTVG